MPVAEDMRCYRYQGYGHRASDCATPAKEKGKNKGFKGDGKGKGLHSDHKGEGKGSKRLGTGTTKELTGESLRLTQAKSDGCVFFDQRDGRKSGRYVDDFLRSSCCGAGAAGYSGLDDGSARRGTTLCSC